MRLGNRVGAVVTGTLVAAALGAGPAHAGPYPTAYNLRTQALTRYPVAGMPEGWVHRDLLLTDGCYRWTLTYNGISHTPRVLHISGDDDYSWDDDLIPTNGKYGQESFLFSNTSETVYENPAGASLTYYMLDDPPSVDMAQVTWGSSLVWLSASC